MTAGTYKVSEVALMAKITVRTLHHYEVTIGTVGPHSGRTEAGYRLYSNVDLIRLQQVLLYSQSSDFRWNGSERSSITTAFDQREALLEQRSQLVQRAERNESADGDEAMDLAEAHRLHFDRSYYPCSHAMHAGLADMYESDALWVQHRQARRRISGVSGGRDPRQREAPVEVNHKRKGPKSTRRAACCANRTNARATGGW